MLVFLFLSACSTSNKATQALPDNVKGQAAQDSQVPDDAGYATTACVEFSSEFPCLGAYVLGCCDDTSCAYIVTDGEQYEIFACDGYDCTEAAEHLATYCSDGGDTGYTSDTGYSYR